MTTSTPNPKDHRHLSDSQWMKHLAMHLVRDPSRVDDVVQEAWVRVLKTSRGPVRERKRWMATVVRHVVMRLASSDASRRRREQSGAPPQSEKAPIDILVEEDLHRELLGQIERLPPTHRDVVTMRFFDGLPPREIARRIGVPLETVKTRLARALDRLRRDLDRETDAGPDWLARLASLFPFLPSRGASKLPPLMKYGGLLMIFPTVVLSALWLTNPSPLTTAEPVLISAPSNANPTSQPTSNPSEPTPSRPTRAQTLVASGDRLTILDATTSDELSGTVVRYVHLDEPSWRGEGNTDSQGRVSLPGPGRYLLHLVADGYLPRVHVHIAEGTESSLSLLPTSEIRVRLHDEKGSPMAGVEVELRAPASSHLGAPASFDQRARLQVGFGKGPVQGSQFAHEALTWMEAALATEGPITEAPPEGPSEVDWWLECPSAFVARKTSGSDGTLSWTGLPIGYGYSAHIVSGHPARPAVPLIKKKRPRLALLLPLPKDHQGSEDIALDRNQEHVHTFTILESSSLRGNLELGRLGSARDVTVELMHWGEGVSPKSLYQQERLATLEEGSSFSWDIVRPGDKQLRIQWFEDRAGEEHVFFVQKEFYLAKNTNLDLGTLAPLDTEMEIVVRVRTPSGSALEPQVFEGKGMDGRVGLRFEDAGTPDRKTRRSGAALRLFNQKSFRPPLPCFFDLEETMILHGLPKGLHRAVVVGNPEATPYGDEIEFPRDVTVCVPRDSGMAIEGTLHPTREIEITVGYPEDVTPFDLSLLLVDETTRDVVRHAIPTDLDTFEPIRVRERPYLVIAVPRTHDANRPNLCFQGRLDGDRLHLELKTGATLFGAIEIPNTNPFSKTVPIVWCDRSGRPYSYSTIAEITPDREGMFRVTGLPPNSTMKISLNFDRELVETGAPGTQTEVLIR